jgi:cell filamentation protein
MANYRYAVKGKSGGGTRYTYDVGNSECFDPYVYPNGTLKNKLSIMDYEELRQEEYKRLKDKVISTQFVHSRRLDSSLLLAIHKYIFDELFDWAGKFRIITLFKAEDYFIPGLSINYSKPTEIEFELKREINCLNSIRWSELSFDEIAVELATQMARIWKIHPFRDGNTRAILGFLKVFSDEHELNIDISVFTKLLSRPKKNGKVVGYSIRDMFVAACLDEKPEPEHLIHVFRRAMHLE